MHDQESCHENEPNHDSSEADIDHDQESDHGNEPNHAISEAENESDHDQETDLDGESDLKSESNHDYSSSEILAEDLNDSISVPSSRAYFSSEDEDLASNTHPYILLAWMESVDWDLG